MLGCTVLLQHPEPVEHAPESTGDASVLTAIPGLSGLICFVKVCSTMSMSDWNNSARESYYTRFPQPQLLSTLASLQGCSVIHAICQGLSQPRHGGDKPKCTSASEHLQLFNLYPLCRDS